jgi:hypothetical protein
MALSISKKDMQSSLIVFYNFFFLEYAGELHIIILRRIDPCTTHVLIRLHSCLCYKDEIHLAPATSPTKVSPPQLV